MGWGHYRPRLVYGFYEENREEIVDSSCLEQYGLDLYCEYTNKGHCFGFVYGLSCSSMEEVSNIDRVIVDRAYESFQKKTTKKYVKPHLMLALTGDMITDMYVEYTVQGDFETEEGDLGTESTAS